MGEKGRKRDERKGETLMVSAFDEDEKDENRDNEVGQLVVCEIRKCFTVISLSSSLSSSSPAEAPQDGLDAKGILEVLKAIVQHPLNESEQQQFLKQLKIEEKSKVKFEEFLPVLIKYLHDGGFSSEGANKRRKLMDSADDEELHKKIKGFVCTYETSPQCEEIRKRMNNFGIGDTNYFDANAIGDTFSSSFKLEFLKKFRVSIVEDADSIIYGLKSGQLDHLLPSVRKLYELLRIVEVFPTPTKRRKVAEDVLRIFSLVLTQGFVEPLVKCLYLQHSELQHLALLSLRLLAPGPDIASTPSDHILHPSKIFFKRSIYTQNPFSVVVDFLNRANPQLCKDALEFIATFSLHHHESRDVVLQHSALPSILSMCSLSPPTPTTPSRPPSPHQLLYPVCQPPPATNDSDLLIVVRTLAIVLGVSHSVSKTPPWHVISPAVPVVASLLFADDPEILVHALAIARFLFPGVPDATIRFRLVELLTSHPSLKVTQATLRALEGIFKYDKQQSELLIRNCGIISILHNLLASRESVVQLAACDALAVIAQFHPDALKEGQTIPLALEKISNYADSSSNNSIVFLIHLMNIFKKFVRGPQALTDYLVGQNVIKILCDALDYAKTFNTALAKDAATNNFEFVNGIIEILEVIVYTGEANTQDNSINTVAITFDVENVRKIYSLLSNIKEGMTQYKVLLTLWEQNGIKKPTHVVEERAKYVLRLILKAHKSRAQTSSAEGKISQAVVDFINHADCGIQQSPAVQEKVLLSCTYNGDTRVISAGADVTLPHLKSLIEQKYEILRPAITYEHTNVEKDNVAVDSKETLQNVISQSKSDNENSLKINITITPPTPQTRKSAPPTPSKKSLHANLTPTLSPTNPFQKSTLAPLLTPLDIDSCSLDLQNLEIIRGQERKALLESLVQTRSLGWKEIEKLYTEWSSPLESESNIFIDGGYISQDRFIVGLKSLGQDDPLVLESYCRSFDSNNEKIYFRQFIVSWSILLDATLEEKLKFVFHVSDKTNKGTINKQELIELMKTALVARSQSMSNQEFNQAIDECFKFTKEKNLSCEEFQKAIMLIPSFVILFIPSIPGLSLI